MVGAMIVLAAVIAGFVVFREINRNDPATPVRDVQYQQTADFARSQADFELLAPETLPDGWRATSVEFVPEPARWHLGLLTDEDRYVGLEQAGSSEQDMVETYVDRDAVRAGTMDVDGTTWKVWTDSGGDTALVRTEGGTTTLVVGTVDRDVLAEFLADLT
jgi:hypothetical protein